MFYKTFLIVNVEILFIPATYEQNIEKMLVFLSLKILIRNGLLFNSKLQRFSIMTKSYAYNMKQPSLVWVIIR